jgi:hypothetical protein
MAKTPRTIKRSALSFGKSETPGVLHGAKKATSSFASQRTRKLCPPALAKYSPTFNIHCLIDEILGLTNNKRCNIHIKFFMHSLGK